MSKYLVGILPRLSLASRLPNSLQNRVLYSKSFKTVSNCKPSRNSHFVITSRNLCVLTTTTPTVTHPAPGEKKKMAFAYPKPRRDETVVDDYFGTKIADPYRWMEDPESEETKQFIEAENNVTRPYLDQCVAKEDIHRRLTELWNYEKYSCPFRRGDRYFFYKNTGLQNQNVLYVQDGLDAAPRVFLDPNALSTDGTVALSGSRFSEDGATLAYGLSASGSDWIQIRLRDVASGKDYPEVLEKVKFATMSWTKDNKGLFYSRYPEQSGKTDGSETEVNRDQKLCYHRLNTPQSEDVLVVDFPEEPLWRIYSHSNKEGEQKTAGAEVSDCGRYLVVSPVRDCRDNLLYVADLSLTPHIDSKLNLTQIVHNFEADYEYVTNEGPICTFRTNKDAPNYRLIQINLDKPQQEHWTTLVPESPTDVLDWASAVDGDKLVLHYVRDVKSVLQLHSLESGALLQTLELAVGSIVGFSGKKDQSEIFYHFMSFLTPGLIYHLDLSSQRPHTPTVFREVKVKGFDAAQYEAQQIFYSSKDGTKVPMFIISKKGAERDGSNPALLYGYGGFNVNIQPTFSVTRLVFIQHLGGIVAVPNIRGGGEYGERWHNGGRLLNKQNVFDDFQGAAEYLVREGWTTPSKLTIQGGSNGGLLVAACLNQRPELYGAGIVQVGVLDMLRFHKFTIGHAWVSDYGSSDNETHFRNLLAYSPLHNIRHKDKDDKEISFPAVLVLTADHDDRVVPLHSLKYVAELQWTLGANSRPILARVDTKAGHGGGKPTSKLIEEHTDILCFITQALGLKFFK